MRNMVVALIGVACVAGCSTVTENTTFDGRNGEAVVLVAADKVPQSVGRTYTMVFSRVDMQASTFLPEWFSIVLDAGLGAVVVNELKKPEGTNTTQRFGARSVVPGDYAYTVRRDHRVNLTTENCYSLSTGVFRIVPGKTNVIALGDILNGNGQNPDPEATLDQAAEVLTAYPNISAPLAIAKQVGVIGFETGKSVGVAYCRHRDAKKISVISETP